MSAFAGLLDDSAKQGKAAQELEMASSWVITPAISKPVTQGGAIMLQETFSLPDGRSVSIQWPASFTPEAYEDFSAWLDIVKRKIGRTVKIGVPSQDGKV